MLVCACVCMRACMHLRHNEIQLTDKAAMYLDNFSYMFKQPNKLYTEHINNVFNNIIINYQDNLKQLFFRRLTVTMQISYRSYCVDTHF